MSLLSAAATAFQAAIAVSTSSSAMSTCVTIRTLPDTTLTPTPCPSSRFATSSGVIAIDASVSAKTMFVSTSAGSRLPGTISATASPRRRARSWSSCRRLGPSSSATRPAAAITPACRQAPPNRILIRRPSRICSAVPQTSDPIGAPSPFETQNISVSTSAAYSATSTPEAALALKIRAPSRWTATPASSATLRMARKSSTSITVPPA